MEWKTSLLRSRTLIGVTYARMLILRTRGPIIISSVAEDRNFSKNVYLKPIPIVLRHTELNLSLASVVVRLLTSPCFCVTHFDYLFFYFNLDYRGYQVRNKIDSVDSEYTAWNFGTLTYTLFSFRKMNHFAHKNSVFKAVLDYIFSSGVGYCECRYVPL